ncbi:MAG: hypothetical protein WDA42_00905 [Candidatus Bathyarchaeia archaeon]
MEYKISNSQLVSVDKIKEGGLFEWGGEAFLRTDEFDESEPDLLLCVELKTGRIQKFTTTTDRYGMVRPLQLTRPIIFK